MRLKAERVDVQMPADCWEGCPWLCSGLTASGLGLRLFLRAPWNKGCHKLCFETVPQGAVHSLPHPELSLQACLLIPSPSPAITWPTCSLFGNFTPGVFLVLSSVIRCLPWEQLGPFYTFTEHHVLRFACKVCTGQQYLFTEMLTQLAMMYMSQTDLFMGLT